ncbi:MAG: hypothetical protein DRO12_01145 [Thermoprotei archaeon]|nr:MAG: hypothetical protein DRO12_01145 [Thermoprotei archaeon]
MEHYEDIKRLVESALLRLCMYQKGDHFFVKPKSIAKRARLSTKPLTLTIVRYALDELAKEGLVLPNGERVHISIWKNGSHGIRYIVVFPERVKSKKPIEGVKGIVV